MKLSRKRQNLKFKEQENENFRRKSAHCKNRQKQNQS